jgi:adenosylcobyric acid synthase
MGTYIHGIFDNDDFRRSILNGLRIKKGLAPLKNTINTYAEKQTSYNRLANTVRNNLNMKLLYEIMEEQ